MRISGLVLPAIAATAARAAPVPAPTFGGASMWDPMSWMNNWSNMWGGGSGSPERSGLGDWTKWAEWSPTRFSDLPSSRGMGDISKWISMFSPTGSTSTTDVSTIPSSTSESSPSRSDGGTGTSTGSDGGAGLAALEKMARQVTFQVAPNKATNLMRFLAHLSAFMSGSKMSAADSTDTTGDLTGTTSDASDSALSTSALDTTPDTTPDTSGTSTSGTSNSTVSKSAVTRGTPATEVQRANKAKALALVKALMQAKTEKAAPFQSKTPAVATTKTSTTT